MATMILTPVDEFVNVMELLEGDKIDVGGTRRNAAVYRTANEWGTGRVSLMVLSRGKVSQVWFDSTASKARRIAKHVEKASDAPVANAKAETVECPICIAGQDEGCVSALGFETDTHAERVALIS